MRQTPNPTAACGLARCAVALCLLAPTPARAEDTSIVAFNTDQPGQVAILVDQQPIATYVYEDEKIPRPYFAHLKAPGGVQVSRNHPPVEGTDVMDHPEFHPGAWLAFGDINGSDYWRLKAPVRHVGFPEPPRGGDGQGSFTVSSRYLSQTDLDDTVCEEVCRYTLHVVDAGYLLVWDSSFSSTEPFTFGDQEEMGLGIRVATPLRVEKKSGRYPDAVAGTGTILDAEGRQNGAEVWGNASAWCDYSGTTGGQHAGITIFCHPDNFRPSWWHARDYGFVTANPFGRQAFKKGEPSKVTVKPGELFQLRYSILLHAEPTDETPDLAAAYKDYLQMAAE